MTMTTIDALVEALESCSVGGHPDIDGDFRKTRWFDEKLVKAALALARAEQAEPVAEPTLIGRWHHGNGALCSGSLRIAQADFDTQPPREFQSKVFDEICEAMNGIIAAYDAKHYPTPPAAPAKLKPVVVTDEMVTRAARELCRLESYNCGVDYDDNWKVYGGMFAADARAALEAAHNAKLGGAG